MDFDVNEYGHRITITLYCIVVSDDHSFLFLTFKFVFVVRCAHNRASYFADRLHNAISGMGTKDRPLVRLLVSHCDVDLGNIKREYEKKYGRSLQAAVSVNHFSIIAG